MRRLTGREDLDKSRSGEREMLRIFAAHRLCDAAQQFRGLPRAALEPQPGMAGVHGQFQPGELGIEKTRSINSRRCSGFIANSTGLPESRSPAPRGLDGEVRVRAARKSFRLAVAWAKAVLKKANRRLTQRGEAATKGGLDRIYSPPKDGSVLWLRIYRMFPLCILSILLIPSKNLRRKTTFSMIAVQMNADFEEYLHSYPIKSASNLR